MRLKSFNNYWRLCAILDHSVSLFSWCIAEELKFIFRQNKCLQSGMIQIQFFFLTEMYFPCKYIFLDLENWINPSKNYTLSIKFGSLEKTLMLGGIEGRRRRRWQRMSWWCYLTISSSATPFSFCLQPFPASGAFPMSWLFSSGGQSIGASASASVLLMNIQGWFPLGLIGLISLQFKGLSRVFSNTIVQKH